MPWGRELKIVLTRGKDPEQTFVEKRQLQTVADLNLSRHRHDCYKGRRVTGGVRRCNLEVRLCRHSDTRNLTSRGELRREHAEQKDVKTEQLP